MAYPRAPVTESPRRPLAPVATIVALSVALSVALDQLTKHWAVAELRHRPSEVLIPDLLDLDYSFNPGSAFGMFSDSPLARPAFIGFTLVALAYMGWLLWRMPARPRLGFVALSLMAGGAVGNLLDRRLRIDSVHGERQSKTIR